MEKATTLYDVDNNKIKMMLDDIIEATDYIPPRIVLTTDEQEFEANLIQGLGTVTVARYNRLINIWSRIERPDEQ